MSEFISLNDRIKEKSYSTGTGGFSLNGAIAGFSAFSDVYSSGDALYYAITDGEDYEVGSGQYINDGLNASITRFPFRSTNSDTFVNFPVGIKEVYVTYPGKYAVFTGYGQSDFQEPQSSGIAFWQTNQILDYTNSIIVDSDNGRLGIGGTPQYALDIRGKEAYAIVRSSGMIVHDSGIMFSGVNNSYYKGLQREPFYKNELDIVTGTTDVFELSGVVDQALLFKKQLPTTVLVGPSGDCGCTEDYPTFRQLRLDDVPTLSGFVMSEVVSNSGWVESIVEAGDNAVSGWADSTMTNRDNSVSGWASSTMTNRDNVISGWADSTMTNRDNAISGWSLGTMIIRDNAISGWADGMSSYKDSLISGWAGGSDDSVSGWALGTFSAGTGFTFNINNGITNFDTITHEENVSWSGISGINVTYSADINRFVIDPIGVSGWAVATMTDKDNVVSGWASSTMTNRDNTVSGWADGMSSYKDSLISGWADATITDRDNDVSGWADATMTYRDNGVSGWALGTFDAGGNYAFSISNGLVVPDTITNNEILYVSGISGINITYNSSLNRLVIDPIGISGWANTTMSDKDNVISGYFEARVGGTEYTAGSGLILVGNEFNTNIEGTGAFSQLHFNDQNIRLGIYSANTISGTGNIAIGSGAMNSAITFERTIIIGQNAGQNCTGASVIASTAVGNHSLRNNNNCSATTAFGGYAASSQDTTDHTINIGGVAGAQQINSSYTINIGDNAGFTSSNCTETILIGKSAGNNCQGINNIYIGSRAGLSRTGDYGIILKNNPNLNNGAPWISASQDYVLDIANTITGKTDSKNIRIGATGDISAVSSATLSVKSESTSTPTVRLYKQTSQTAAQLVSDTGNANTVITSNGFLKIPTFATYAAGTGVIGTAPSNEGVLFYAKVEQSIYVSDGSVWRSIK